MVLIYQGKTKDLFKAEDGSYYFHFKDDVTGEDGVFDPGANQVGAVIQGAGHANVVMSRYYFELLQEHGIPTHYIEADVNENIMKIKKASVFGQGLEVICRFKAVGSFIRRYGLYATSGQDLDAYVEFTLKDDDRQDPLINQDALEALNILKVGEYDQLKTLTQKISNIIKEDLKTKGLELYDIKLEFGRLADSDEIVLIDEISSGNMRVYQGVNAIEPLELANYFNNEENNK